MQGHGITPLAPKVNEGGILTFGAEPKTNDCFVSINRGSQSIVDQVQVPVQRVAGQMNGKEVFQADLNSLHRFDPNKSDYKVMIALRGPGAIAPSPFDYVLADTSALNSARRPGTSVPPEQQAVPSEPKVIYVLQSPLDRWTHVSLVAILGTVLCVVMWTLTRDKNAPASPQATGAAAPVTTNVVTVTNTVQVNSLPVATNNLFVPLTLTAAQTNSNGVAFNGTFVVGGNIIVNPGQSNSPAEHRHNHRLPTASIDVKKYPSGTNAPPSTNAPPAQKCSVPSHVSHEFKYPPGWRGDVTFEPHDATKVRKFYLVEKCGPNGFFVEHYNMFCIPQDTYMETVHGTIFRMLVENNSDTSLSLSFKPNQVL